jgi:uncharacterized protein
MRATLLCLLLVLNVIAAGTAHQEANMNSGKSILDVLVSNGPSGEIPQDSDIYGWLLGSWSVRVVDYSDDGSKKETAAEWHFARVLEGRAIQDVFIVPSRDQRSATLPKQGNRYGTSVRVYDSRIGAWHVTWINPVRGVENQLIGRKIGNEIIQEGRDEDGALMRWSFRDITPNSFRWTGEQSTDNGKTWQLGAEFFAVRITERK